MTWGYDPHINDWCCGKSAYEILIGKSSRDIVLKKEIQMTRSNHEKKVTENTCCSDLLKDPGKQAIVGEYLTGFMDVVGGGSEAPREAITDEMNKSMLDNMPLRALRSFTGMTNEMLTELLEKLNKSQAQHVLEHSNVTRKLKGEKSMKSID